MDSEIYVRFNGEDASLMERKVLILALSEICGFVIVVVAAEAHRWH